MCQLNYNLYIKQIHRKLQIKIHNKLYAKIHIIGKKLLSNNIVVHIIEFKDHTRLWIFKEEIQIIKQYKLSKKEYEI
uniref:Conserved hypothetical plastid protein n=1 Tax=Gastroclonium compressum TaxID=1852973 RepID=A0A173G039_GASCM|nr:conserved hypothetical plastid protein [Coeloseira compressa]ANH09646.1 conserved hypothetical plastid protein [Coeloseira compressa]